MLLNNSHLLEKGIDTPPPPVPPPNYCPPPPRPRRSRSGHDTSSIADFDHGTGAGTIEDRCLVCDRRHGDVAGPAPDKGLGWGGECGVVGVKKEEGEEEGEGEVAWLLYLRDSQTALERAATFFAAVHGANAGCEELMEVLGTLRVVRKYATSRLNRTAKA